MGQSIVASRLNRKTRSFRIRFFSSGLKSFMYDQNEKASLSGNYRKLKNFCFMIETYICDRI